MTHIHPDSIRLLLRCRWELLDNKEFGCHWRHADCGFKTITEALALCREAQPTPSVEEEK